MGNPLFRTKSIKQILAEWSQAKLHEATLIVRVAGINPTISEDSRK